MLKITWKKSTIGRPDSQFDCIRTLGLKKLNQSVVREDTPETRGILARVNHLVTVEEV
ncbi:MAG: 50S ribosomal protein L30 [Solirubrobacterales bacterium]